jgi:hypothetical protein
MTDFQVGQWVVSKSFDEWYNLAANMQNFDPINAKEWYDLEWPKNVLKITKVREADQYDDEGTAAVSPFLYFEGYDKDWKQVGYSYRCFRHLTTEEQDLMDVLFG